MLLALCALVPTLLLFGFLLSAGLTVKCRHLWETKWSEHSILWLVQNDVGGYTLLSSFTLAPCGLAFLA